MNMGMGWDKPKIKQALKAAFNDSNRAVQYLFDVSFPHLILNHLRESHNIYYSSSNPVLNRTSVDKWEVEWEVFLDNSQVVANKDSPNLEAEEVSHNPVVVVVSPNQEDKTKSLNNNNQISNREVEIIILVKELVKEETNLLNLLIILCLDRSCRRVKAILKCSWELFFN